MLVELATGSAEKVATAGLVLPATAPCWKPVPVMVKAPTGALAPRDGGLIDEIVGGTTKVKVPPLVPVPAGVVIDIGPLVALPVNPDGLARDILTVSGPEGGWKAGLHMLAPPEHAVAVSVVVS